MISAPTNPVSVNCVGTGVLDRPLTQQNLRTVREAGPYAHRDRLYEIKEPDKPNLSELCCFTFYSLCIEQTKIKCYNEM